MNESETQDLFIHRLVILFWYFDDVNNACLNSITCNQKPRFDNTLISRLIGFVSLEIFLTESFQEDLMYNINNK